MSARSRIAVVATFFAVATAATRAQSAQRPAPSPDIELELSASAVRRTNGVFTAIAEAGNFGADRALDALFGVPGTTTKSAVARLARLWFVNLPIASLLQGIAHDYGHFARLDEAGIHARHRDITTWPWPAPITISVEDFGPVFELPQRTQLGVFGAGEQASTALKQELTDKIYSRDTSTYFDWVLLGYAALDFPVYCWTDLSPGALRSFSDFQSGTGDFRQYSALSASLDPASDGFFTIRQHANALRRAAWLNLMDYALFGSVARIAEYVKTGAGDAGNPSIQIGRLHLVPGAYATLGSLGLEKGVDVRVVGKQYLSQFEIRRTQTAADRHLWGAGFRIRSRNGAALRPEARVDVWRRSDPGLGARFELGARRPIPRVGGRLEGALSIGYKTRGFLTDAPFRAGPQFSVMLTIR